MSNNEPTEQLANLLLGSLQLLNFPLEALELAFDFPKERLDLGLITVLVTVLAILVLISPCAVIFGLFLGVLGLGGWLGLVLGVIGFWLFRGFGRGSGSRSRVRWFGSRSLGWGSSGGRSGFGTWDRGCAGGS
jgi:hypothetical protein